MSFFLLLGIASRNINFHHSSTFRTPASNDIDLGSGVMITHEQLKEIADSLPETSEDQVFHHWTKEQLAIRWILQGGTFNQGEMDSFNKPSGNLQAYGPGFYMAKSQTSSQSFGNVLVEVKIPASTKIYDQNIVNQVLGVNLNKEQMSELGKHIPFIRNLDGDWHLLNHQSLIDQSLRIPTELEISFKNNNMFKSTLNFYAILWSAIRDDGEGQKLDSLLALSHYQDGISYVRSLNVNPDNPWGEFEPEHFEKFRESLKKIVARSIHKFENTRNDINRFLDEDSNFISYLKDEIVNGALEADMGIVSGDKFGSNLSKEDWVEYQIENVLSKMFEEVSGESCSIDDAIRCEGIRAGGTQEGKTFLATNADTANMIKNPYLEVNYKPNPNGDGQLIEYFYPDVFHFKHLEGRISDELFRELSDADPQLLYESDHELRKSLNKKLIRELLTDLFTRYHGEKAAYDTGMSVNLMRDLISIHPFENYNGRISREYFLSTNLQMNREVPIHMLADFDLLKSVDFYRKLLISTEEHYQEFRKGMLVELLNSRMEKRSPSYENIPELNKLLNSFKVMGIDEDLPLDQDDLELIRQRRFTEYFDKNLNENWRFSDFTGVVNVFSSFKDENLKKEYLNNLIDSDIINDGNTEDIKKILDGIDNIDELYEFSKLIERTNKVRIKELCRSYFVNKISEESTLKANHKKFLKQIIIENDQYKVSLTAKAYSFLLNYFASKNSLNIPKDKILAFVKNISDQTGWHTRRDVAKELSDIRDNDYALSFLKIFSNDSDGDVRSATFKSLKNFIANSDDEFIINYVDSLLTQDGFDQTDANIIFYALTEDKISVKNPKYGDFILEHKDLFSWNKRRDLARMFTQKSNDLNTIRILKIFSNDSNGDVRSATFKSLENFIANSDDEFIINYVDSLLTQDGFDQTDANIVFHAIMQDKVAITKVKYSNAVKNNIDSFPWTRRKELAVKLGKYKDNKSVISLLHILTSDKDGDVRRSAIESIKENYNNSKPSFQNSCSAAIKALMAN
ncbi:MAG: HEAT repeat domain-containing protein [Bdellovibrionota bacterium]|nr:HEAT repeat domain-containing protein [Bdellovibrionota bacterium]